MHKFNQTDFGVNMCAMAQNGVRGSICALVWSLVTAVSIPTGFADEVVAGSNRIEVLKMIIARNEANRRKIETWQGTYRFIDRFPQRIRVQPDAGNPGDAKSQQAVGNVEERDVIMIREGLAKMALDVAGDRIWTDFQEDSSKTQVIHPDTKEVIRRPEGYVGYEQRTVLVPDSELVFLPNVKYGPVTDIEGDPLQLSSDKLGRLAERKGFARTLKLNDTDEIVDPRSFYKEGNRYIGEVLTVSLDGLLGKYGEEERTWVDDHMKVSRSGVAGALQYEVTQQYRNSSEPQLNAIGLFTQTVRFSERDGYLPVEDCKFSISGEPQTTRSWKYQQTDGILVPSEYHYTLSRFKDSKIGKGAILVLDRHLVLVEAKLNDRLTEELFAPEGLDLQKGDRLLDRIEEKLLVHDGARLVPASEYVESLQRKTGWFFWLNVAICVGLAAIFVWRRRRVRVRPAA
jgi:hypothetical protein